MVAYGSRGMDPVAQEVSSSTVFLHGIQVVVLFLVTEVAGLPYPLFSPVACQRVQNVSGHQCQNILRGQWAQVPLEQELLSAFESEVIDAGV